MRFHAVFALFGLIVFAHESAADPAGKGNANSVSATASSVSSDLWNYYESNQNPAYSVQPLFSDQLAQGAEAEQAQSEKCRRLAHDVDADLGVVLRAGCKPSLAQMSKLMDNPLGNVAMDFNQIDFSRFKSDRTGKTANVTTYSNILQFPKGVSENWNLINRIVLTVPSLPLEQGKIDNFSGGTTGGLAPPGSAPAPIDVFGGRTTSLGDTYYVGLFSPKKGIKHDTGGTSVWGLGFDLAFPTAFEEILGSGRFSAGPSALYAYLGPKWKIGGLLQHYWDYAGDDDRADVNTTNLQYFVYYSLDDTSSIGVGPNIICNWESDPGNNCTVPIGFGYNKTFQFGKVPVRFGGEIHYSIYRPEDDPGAEWNFRFFVIPAVPSALFKWLD